MSRVMVRTSLFMRDRSGSVSILLGLSCVVLVGMIGLAVDMARYYNYESHMQQALDASALAGAKMLDDDSKSDAAITATATAYFTQTMASGGIDAISLPSPVVSIDRLTNTVQVSSRAQLPPTFSSIITGSRLVAINQSSQVVYDMKNIELSMVLDITGSMNQKNKINDLKTAAKDIIDDLYANSTSENAVRIAAAPYSASVNAGGLADDVTSVPATTRCSRSWWGHSRCNNSAGVDIDTCVIERQGRNAATDAAPVGSDMLPNVPTIPYGNYVCPASTVVPLMGKSQKDSLKATIDGYVASGATAGHIGTAWGWYLLSPEWATVLGDSAPGPYDSSKVQKSMIIMTDGEFNTSYRVGANAAPAVQTESSYAQFDALCNGIKGKGIKVFTVGFDLNDPRALSELAACATSSENFFDVKTGTQLKKAFQDIAKRLNTLRVAG